MDNSSNMCQSCVHEDISCCKHMKKKFFFKGLLEIASPTIYMFLKSLPPPLLSAKSSEYAEISMAVAVTAVLFCSTFMPVNE